MSQSILYHAFGIKGVTYHRTEFIGNNLVFRVETNDKFIPCPACGHRGSIFKGQKNRWFRMPPIGRKQGLLHVVMHRIQCKECNHLWWPNLSFAEGNARYTRSFAQTVLDLLSFGTIRSVAEYLRVSWDLIKNIHRSYLASKYRAIDLSDVKYLGMDEFSIKKGHKYMTIFVDMQTGRILHAVEGTSKEAIAPFLKILAKKAKKLKAVSMDMSASFSSAVKEHLPTVPLVFDRYHVMALLNRNIDSLRRELQRELEEDGKKILKGCRFLLLNNYHALEDEKQQKLNTLLEANQPLFTMHAMKEQLRLFWEQRSAAEAKSFLRQWCFDALTSGIKQLCSVGLTLFKRIEGLLSYYPHKITNGPIEGLNNKIKTMKRQAYGFRDMEYFTLRLYDLHTTRYAFAG
ncbi:MAG: ISL3 family transposase [Desulfobulbaceae bacterium]|nr:ISL3 family transposase [Desulfobulbaceae bacterium]